VTNPHERRNHSSPERARTKSGSNAVAAALAAQAVANEGATRLEALAVGGIAAFGENCFLTYDDLRELDSMLRPDGRRYHRESIGRAVRNVARRLSAVRIERVHPGQKPRGAKWFSAHGTTNKSFNFKKFGLKSALSRHPEPRRTYNDSRKKPAAEPVSGRPRYPTPPPAVLKPTELDPQLAALTEQIERSYERQWDEQEALDLQRMSRSIRSEHGPP